MAFETIAKSNGSDNFGLTAYREEEPTLLVITSDEEIDDLTQSVLTEEPALADQLRQLDYDRFFATLALQGLKSTGGSSITVQQIGRQDNQVTVWAQFVDPALETRRIAAFTLPYHLVAVSKKGAWGQQIRFVLMKDDEMVAETSHFVP